jgi:hypothetical protein
LKPLAVVFPEEQDNINAFNASIQSKRKNCEARTSADSSKNIATAVRPPPRRNILNSLAGRKHKNISSEKEAARMEKESENMLKKTADIGSKSPRRSKRLSSTKETVVTSSSQSAPNINEEEKTQPTKSAKEGKKSKNAAAIRKSYRNTKHHAEHDDNEENNTSEKENDEYNEVNMIIFLSTLDPK